MVSTSLLVLGGGGHAKVLLDCLRAMRNVEVLGILDVSTEYIGKSILGVTIIGHEEEILKNYLPSSVHLVNGLGSTRDTTKREKIFKKCKDAGYKFLNIVHPTAYVGDEVSMGEGVQLMARSTIQPGCHIGNNSIINTHSSVDHDCYIGDHVHLSPGVTCCGNVTIAKGTHIGCGAVILQGIKIGENCLIAAGAIVTRDVMAGSKVAGVPAKMME